MPAAIHEPILFWQVFTPPVQIRDGASHGPSGPKSHPPQRAWHSQVFAAAAPQRTRRRATRYEKFTTRMVLLSACITFGVTLGLHVANYGLETRTSSTSGTHSTFYKDGE
ncbi:hypothetical protein FM113_12715 [Leucobacter sp. 7(1)]|uniref:hypothetical protein n=1 Tax=Leucobacter sp. 7(1) TaxID=1255613 RepID=UPI00097E7C37|nr:hypothetical protein [Leucobacter sp. 7(1)]SJN11678.1 hypothetical protein FM113_12715 [Leucobacter sp. 7(1)]